MSTVAISYSSIGDAAGEAKAVARKLDSYASSIRSSVYNKLHSYNGEWNSNVTAASNHLNTKISDLEKLSDRYDAYATSLTDMRSACKSTDEAVKSRVSSLTAAFKQSHGIKNSKVENALNYFMTSLGNSSRAGRWLGDGMDMLDAGKDYVKQMIEDWYDYEGGKQVIKGVLTALISIAIAVVGVVATIITGGAFLVVLAAVVGGVIAAINGLVDLGMELSAYHETHHNNDPATGRRNSNINSASEWLRKKTDSEGLHILANGIDVLEFACTAVTVVSELSKLLSKGAGWLSCTKAKNIKDFRGVSLKQFASGVGQRFAKMKLDFTLTTMSIKLDPMGTLGFFAKQGGANFLSTLKNSYGNFSTADDVYKTVKNYGNFAKDILGDGLDVQDVVRNLGLNGIGFGHGDSAGGSITSLDSIGKFEFKLGDYKKFADISNKIGKNGIQLWDKMSERSSTSIAIPDITIPQVNIPNVAVGY